MRRVGITGIGFVTCLGTGTDSVWDALLAGTLGFSEVESFDSSRHRFHVGAEIKDFDGERLGLSAKEVAELGRATQFGLIAGRAALRQAGLNPESDSESRYGVCMGTTSGEPLEVERLNDDLLNGESARAGSGFLGRYPSGRIASQIATACHCTALPPMMFPTACAAGAYAVSHAYDQIRNGRADCMLAGGADAFSRITYTGFAALLAIAPDVCRPFSLNRKGMIPGEGACVLVLESIESAVRRGAHVYAELAGYGLSCDAFHMTGSHPEGTGAVSAMQRALDNSRIAPAEVDYISAHGTGTPSNDRNETQSIRRVFGEQADRIPVSSIKSMIGHTMGAASAIETGVCALALERGVVPPTMNYDAPDSECDLDYVPNEKRDVTLRYAMNNAYAFGGTNASLVLKRHE